MRYNVDHLKMKCTYVQTFSVTGGPADVIGSWFSEEWFGSNAADGSFTYQAKDGELASHLAPLSEPFAGSPSKQGLVSI